MATSTSTRLKIRGSGSPRSWRRSDFAVTTRAGSPIGGATTNRGGWSWVFLERTQEGSAVLVIAPDAPVGVPGRYPMPAGYLDRERYATLEALDSESAIRPASGLRAR